MIVVNKVKLATFFVRLFRLSRILQKCYPIAINVEFGDVQPDKIKRLLLALQPKVEVSSRIKRFGSVNDGGYFLIDDFAEVSGVLSFGIGDNNSFDVDISQYVPVVDMYDHTIADIPSNFPNGKFHRTGISANPSVGFTTVAQILDSYKSSGDLILKIDIEGSEWEILDTCSGSNLLRFSQIVGEFHHLFRYITDLEFRELVDRVLHKIEQTHSIYFQHANNWARHEVISGIYLPDVIELNFVRKDFPQIRKIETTSTVIQSYPNNPLANEVNFSFMK
jgi:hypothetical protein